MLLIAPATQTRDSAIERGVWPALHSPNSCLLSISSPRPAVTLTCSVVAVRSRPPFYRAAERPPRGAHLITAGLCWCPTRPDFDSECCAFVARLVLLCLERRNTRQRISSRWRTETTMGKNHTVSALLASCFSIIGQWSLLNECSSLLTRMAYRKPNLRVTSASLDSRARFPPRRSLHY